MNNKQVARYNMSRTTIGIIENHKDIWEKDKFLSEIVNEVKKIQQEIQKTHADQSVSTSPIALQKKIYRENLSNTIFLITNIICSYAVSNNNIEVYTTFNITRTKIKKLHDQYVALLAKEVTDYATANKAELKPYGYTNEIAIEFKKQIKDYKSYIVMPAYTKGMISAATQHLEELLKSLRQVLITKLDKSMVKYSVTHNDFYCEYCNARYIRNLPSHRLSIKVIATDAETGNPINYVKITALQEAVGNNQKTAINHTSKNGICKFKHLETGIWTVTAEAWGYKTYIINIDIEPSTMYKLEIKMMKTIK